MLCAEELSGAVAREIFDYIRELTAAVVALSGIAFGVFIGEDGADGFEDGAADEVLGGDHLKTFVLAVHFIFQLLGDLRIGGAESCGEVNRHDLHFMPGPDGIMTGPEWDAECREEMGAEHGEQGRARLVGRGGLGSA